jgi:hypothetical protein
MLKVALLLLVVAVMLGIWKLAGVLEEVGHLTDEWRDEPWSG